VTDQAYKRGYDRIVWKPLPPVERKPRRASGKRADFPTPMMIRDFDEPVQSMADGKWYGSKAALARSHRAAHNPHGQDFIELGNEQMPFVEHKPDVKAERQTIRKAIHDVENGWRPDVVALDD
jgi:hypothetical protein